MSQETNGVIASVLMCHAPIVIQEIAQKEFTKVQKTSLAMTQAARYVVSQKPDLVVVISPHAPRHPSHYGFYANSDLKGDFVSFGFTNLKYNFKNASLKIQDDLKANSLFSFQKTLDHGALVPLHFLNELNYTGSVLVIALPYEPNHYLNEDFGKQLNELAEKHNERWVILGSGDMSHRLQDGAPAGYHPDAKLFDEYFVSEIKNKNYFQATHGMNQKVREIAAEDMMDSAEIALSAIQYKTIHPEVLSYEAPFGVGYLVATL